MRIYLTGFMGSGKTTVGRLLAHRLGFTFYDLDDEIEKKLSRTVPEIFAAAGEEEFRNQEKRMLESLTAQNAVIATGGGCFIFHKELLLQLGKVVFLDVPFETLVSRIGADPSRPLWKNASHLFKERKEIYRQAHFTVNGSQEPEKVVDDILQALQIS